MEEVHDIASRALRLRRFFSRGLLGVVMQPDTSATAMRQLLNRDIANGSPINDTPYVHYVMENDGSEAPTEIQVRATFA